MPTNVLGLPLIAESQAKKEITHNQALYLLDAWTSVQSKTNSGPPGSPTTGDRYIVDVASGAWSGFTIGDLVAYYQDSSGAAAWVSTTPAVGPSVYVVDETAYYSWDGAAWALLASTAGVIDVTASKTLGLSDGGTVQRVTAAATITIPTETTTDFPVGSVITIRRATASAVTVSAGGSPTPTINGSLTLAAENDSIQIMKVDENEWDVY